MVRFPTFVLPCPSGKARGPAFSPRLPPLVNQKATTNLDDKRCAQKTTLAPLTPCIFGLSVPRRLPYQSSALDIEATFKRLQSNNGVLGVIALNSDGVAIRSTFEPSKTSLYAGELTPLLDRTRASIKNLDPDDELQFVRYRTKKYEIVIAPDAAYYLVAVQSISD